NNILKDSILVLTSNDGYYISDISKGLWYKIGEEIPKLNNLHNALQRHSMSCELFPRSSPPKLFFAGGLVMGKPISTIAELDIESMKISPVVEMPFPQVPPRAYCSMVFWPDSLMIIGGYNGWDKILSDCAQYDFLKNKWYRCNKLLYPRYRSSAITIDDKFIFLTGGCDKKFSILDTEWYDRNNKQWINIGHLLFPSQRSHSIKFHDLIYLVSSNSNIIQFYDLIKQSWFIHKSHTLHYSYSLPKFSIHNDGDLLICSNKTNLHSYQIFDLQTHSWIATTYRNHPVHAFYPFPLIQDLQVIDWFSLGRRFW
ncbi:hypothetical protein RFI_33156, partial [Reticulomyxa filosa]